MFSLQNVHCNLCPSNSWKETWLWTWAHFSNLRFQRPVEYSKSELWNPHVHENWRKKTIIFANVKLLLFRTNRCCFVKTSVKSLSILMGIYCKNSRVSPKLEVFPAHSWLGALNLHLRNDLVPWFSPCIFVHSGWALTPTFLCCFVTQDKSAEISSLTFAKNCFLFWAESNFFTIFL